MCGGVKHIPVKVDPEKSHNALLARYFSNSTKYNGVTPFKLLHSFLTCKYGNTGQLLCFLIHIHSQSLTIIIYLTGSKMEIVFFGGGFGGEVRGGY